MWRKQKTDFFSVAWIERVMTWVETLGVTHTHTHIHPPHTIQKLLSYYVNECMTLSWYHTTIQIYLQTRTHTHTCYSFIILLKILFSTMLDLLAAAGKCFILRSFCIMLEYGCCIESHGYKSCQPLHTRTYYANWQSKINLQVANSIRATGVAWQPTQQLPSPLIGWFSTTS